MPPERIEVEAARRRAWRRSLPLVSVLLLLERWLEREGC